MADVPDNVVEVREQRVGATRSHDGGDLELLFAVQRGRMCGLAAAVTFDRSVADEIVQEAFARFLESGSNIENPAGYLRRSVINLAITFVRRRERARRLPVHPIEPAMNPEVDDVWGVLEQLSARQRAVVVLRFYEDQSYEQIASTLSMPVGTVKSTLHRALSALKEKLQ